MHDITPPCIAGDEQPEPQEFELSQDNRQQMFQINIPNDHVVDTLNNHKRSFTLEMVFSSGNTDKVNISSSVLEVVIKDNDTGQYVCTFCIQLIGTILDVCLHIM